MVAFGLADNTVTSCSREPVRSDSHFALLLFRGATWSSGVCELTARFERWCCSGSH